ncbi:MAG: putative immunity protein [Pseudomonadota bacterium]
MIDNTKLVEILESRHACDPALEWLEQRNSDEMWEHCERPDWLLWWAARHVPRKELVLVACQCARLALPYVDAGEIRPIKAIETAEAWTRGEVELEEVKGAANAASRAASRAAYAALAADDAPAAAYAAEAAYAAAQSRMCEIIRQQWPTCPEPGRKG